MTASTNATFTNPATDHEAESACCAPSCCGGSTSVPSGTTSLPVSALPDPTELSDDDLRAAVRERYAASARQATEARESGAGRPSCCSTGPASSVVDDPITRDLYDTEAEQVAPGALAASLGCGNPTLLADLKPGQRVLDLGSGGGLDVLLSARRVAPTGMAYGLDMTPEMLDLARRNQAETGLTNAEFLLGTIESIPLDDDAVDVVISNCVINLAADKDAVLAEAFRVLAPGGHFAVSDIVVLRELPEVARRAMRLWTGCVAGALLDTDYVAKLSAAGFIDATVEVTRAYSGPDLLDLAAELRPADLGLDAEDTAGLAELIAGVIASMDGAVASAFVRAVKPA
jgi:SAM-dependent methyltransferase